MEENKLSQLIQIGYLVIKVLVVVFAITGTVQLFKAVFKTVAFDEYPLESYELISAPAPDGKTSAITEQDIENTRKLRMLEDYAGSISMILVSGGLYWLGKRKNG